MLLYSYMSSGSRPRVPHSLLRHSMASAYCHGNLLYDVMMIVDMV